MEEKKIEETKIEERKKEIYQNRQVIKWLKRKE